MDNLMQGYVRVMEDRARLAEELDIAKERILELKTVLRWYANPHNYGIGGGSSQHIHVDAGQRASTVLKNDK